MNLTGVKKEFKQFSKEVKKDFAFINEYTELFTIWTFFYTLLAIVCFFLFKTNAPILLAVLFSTVIVMIIASISAIFYVRSIMYSKNSTMVKFHKKLNTSYSLPRVELRFGGIRKFVRIFSKTNLKLAFK